MMSKEEFERKMVFIVNQQAQFAVDIEKLYEAQVVTEQKIQEANAVVTRLAYVTNYGFKDVNAKIDALVNSQFALQESQRQTDAQIKRTDEQIQRTDEQIQQTHEEIKQTDEKLRQLTATVDRYIRRRNGG